MVVDNAIHAPANLPSMIKLSRGTHHSPQHPFYISEVMLPEACNEVFHSQLQLLSHQLVMQGLNSVVNLCDATTA
ncbi:MAG: hypothetical protein HC767_01325 [Akkermansiaceae bacterium]|nr:hypothetical protein [Akkermansiaceae bacterium]